MPPTFSNSPTSLKAAISPTQDGSPERDPISRSAATRRRLTRDEKVALARAWVESVRSGRSETQAAFARRHGLSSPRLLRAWVRKFVPGTRWDAELRHAVRTALAALSAIAAAMDRMADGLPAAPSSMQPSTAASPTGTRARFRFDDDGDRSALVSSDLAPR